MSSTTFADTYTWTPTAGGAQSWINSANWTVGGNPTASFPNATSDSAVLSVDIAGDQNVQLNTPITLGSLTLNDVNSTSASSEFQIANGSGTNTLTLQSATVGGQAFMTIGGGTGSSPTHNIGVLTQIGGTSSLAIDIASTQHVAFTNEFAIGGQSVTVGGSGSGNVNFSGALTGDGTITLGSLGGSNVTGAKAFTGTFVLNRGISGTSNTGTLTVTNGSIASAAEVIINGFLSGSSTGPTSTIQNGGSLQAGNGSQVGANPGQRITQNTITLNGGTMTVGGQPATVGVANTWQQGLEYHSETVSTLNFGSGGSVLSLSAGGNTQGYQLTIGTLSRGAGAGAFVRSTTLGGATQFSASNGAALLKGAGGLNGTSTMSIIPWMLADGGASSPSSPNAFATIDTTTGLIRQLTDAETPGAVGSGATANVASSVLTMANDTTVNSMRFTASGAQLIATAQNAGGEARTLTVTSGGVFMSGNGGTIGTVGEANAGTLNFGAAEAVVWSVNANANTIGAAITGSGGFTKAGTGTLTLAGDNSGLSGDVHVSGGTLRIGDGGDNESTVGSAGSVRVHNGAILQISSTDAILDTASLTLDAFGLFNGKIVLDEGVNEVVGSLYFGTLLQPGMTYGSTTSGADFQSDVWFGGTGILTVAAVPEPASFGIAMVGMLALAGRRRR